MNVSLGWAELSYFDADWEAASFLIGLEVATTSDDAFAANFDWNLRLANRRRNLVLSGCDIELPSVPGACDNFARKLPFAKWAALVRADPVQRVVLASDAKYRHDPAGRHDFDRCAVGDFGDRGKFYPVRIAHRLSCFVSRNILHSSFCILHFALGPERSHARLLGFHCGFPI